MSRRDPGTATGVAPSEPDRCGRCKRLATLHEPRTGGRRGPLLAVGCSGYLPDSNVVAFPGVGVLPAPGPRPVPADLDGIGDRYTELLEARHRLARFERPADAAAVRLLEAACADDVPVLREEVHRVELLRRELADELDRIRGGKR